LAFYVLGKLKRKCNNNMQATVSYID
jgi:hypothetical protein